MLLLIFLVPFALAIETTSDLDGTYNFSFSVVNVSYNFSAEYFATYHNMLFNLTTFHSTFVYDDFVAPSLNLLKWNQSGNSDLPVDDPTWLYTNGTSLLMHTEASGGFYNMQNVIMLYNLTDHNLSFNVVTDYEFDGSGTGLLQFRIFNDSNCVIDPLVDECSTDGSTPNPGHLLGYIANSDVSEKYTITHIGTNVSIFNSSGIVGSVSSTHFPSMHVGFAVISHSGSTSMDVNITNVTMIDSNSYDLSVYINNTRIVSLGGDLSDQIVTADFSWVNNFTSSNCSCIDCVFSPNFCNVPVTFQTGADITRWDSAMFLSDFQFNHTPLSSHLALLVSAGTDYVTSSIQFTVNDTVVGYSNPHLLSKFAYPPGSNISLSLKDLTGAYTTLNVTFLMDWQLDQLEFSIQANNISLFFDQNVDLVLQAGSSVEYYTNVPSISFNPTLYPLGPVKIDISPASKDRYRQYYQFINDWDFNANESIKVLDSPTLIPLYVRVQDVGSASKKDVATRLEMVNGSTSESNYTLISQLLTPESGELVFHYLYAPTNFYKLFGIKDDFTSIPIYSGFNESTTALSPVNLYIQQNSSLFGTASIMAPNFYWNSSANIDVVVYYNDVSNLYFTSDYNPIVSSLTPDRLFYDRSGASNVLSVLGLLQGAYHLTLRSGIDFDASDPSDIQVYVWDYPTGLSNVLIANFTIPYKDLNYSDIGAIPFEDLDQDLSPTLYLVVVFLISIVLQFVFKGTSSEIGKHSFFMLMLFSPAIVFVFWPVAILSGLYYVMLALRRFMQSAG